MVGICSTLVCEGTKALTTIMRDVQGAVEIPNPYAPAGGK
jgi:hypothetical protein